MRWHWLRDRVRQGQFDIFWREGTSNLADFFTKPLPVELHFAIMPYLVNIIPSPLMLKKATFRKYRSQ